MDDVGDFCRGSVVRPLGQHLLGDEGTQLQPVGQRTIQGYRREPGIEGIVRLRLHAWVERLNHLVTGTGHGGFEGDQGGGSRLESVRLVISCDRVHGIINGQVKDGQVPCRQGWSGVVDSDGRHHDRIPVQNRIAGCPGDQQT